MTIFPSDRKPVLDDDGLLRPNPEYKPINQEPEGYISREPCPEAGPGATKTTYPFREHRDQSWMVTEPREEGCCTHSHEVEAPALNIENGCLVFKDVIGQVLRAYAPGEWTMVVKGGVGTR